MIEKIEENGGGSTVTDGPGKMASLQVRISFLDYI